MAKPLKGSMIVRKATFGGCDNGIWVDLILCSDNVVFKKRLR